MGSYFDIVNTREGDIRRFLVCANSGEEAIGLLRAAGEDGDFEFQDATEKKIEDFGPLSLGDFRTIPHA